MYSNPNNALISELQWGFRQAWPAHEEISLGPWVGRFFGGVTRRANSIWPSSAFEADLQARVEQSEAECARRALRCRFLLGPVPGWRRLDALLARRGYGLEAPTWVLAAPLDLVLERPSRTDAGAGVGERGVTPVIGNGTAASYYGTQGRFRLERPWLARLLSGLPRASACVYVGPSMAPVGVALLSLVGSGDRWLSLSEMEVGRRYRGQGLGKSLLREAAGWARQQGARGICLQVERENQAALALYRGMGLRVLYGCHYRRAPALLV